MQIGVPKWSRCHTIFQGTYYEYFGVYGLHKIYNMQED